MSMTKAEGRTRVLQFVDAEYGSRFSTTEVEQALATAQRQVVNDAVSAGRTEFIARATVTTSSAGVATLTSLKPLTIKSVATYQNGARWPIPRASYLDGLTNYTGVQTLEVMYAPRPTFPANDGDNFVWGTSAVDDPIFDEFMVALAASTLKVKTGEVNAALERRIESLRGSLEDAPRTAPWQAMPMVSRPRTQSIGIRYVEAGYDQLQLVW